MYPIDYINIIISALVFFLPAYIANAMPVIANKLNIFKPIAFPINKKVFGKAKTYRGFFVGIIGALIVGAIQSMFGYYGFFVKEGTILFTLLLSFYLGFGALLGDLVKSYIKRKIGKKSGKPWIIFDQIDYVIGALLMSYILVQPPMLIIIILLIISPIFSITANIIAYKLKIKKVWW